MKPYLGNFCWGGGLFEVYVDLSPCTKFIICQNLSRYMYANMDTGDGHMGTGG